MRSCEIPEWPEIVRLVVILLLEKWLGKTRLVRAGSILELIQNIIKTLWSWYKPRSKEMPKAKNIPMEIAYDFAVLGKRLVAAGLIATEEVVGDVYDVTKSWLKESAEMTTQPYDNIIMSFIPQVDAVILPLIDGIADEEADTAPSVPVDPPHEETEENDDQPKA